MTGSLSLSDRQGARTVSLETSLLLRESHQHYLTPANRFTLGYNIAFLERITEFNGEVVPADFAPSTGRVHSVVLRYQRDTRIPTPRWCSPQCTGRTPGVWLCATARD